MSKISITINDQEYKVNHGQTIMEVCKEHNIKIPQMCHFEGLTDVGACRLCLVEVEGSAKLLPSCTTKVEPNQRIKTHSEKLNNYRQMITELFFSERNHVCAVCVANGNCELQNLATEVGMEHVRFAYLFQECEVDASHDMFVIDHNRCIMCTRCVRVCGEVEGAHNWDVKNRGYNVRIISDFDTPWGESQSCTSCRKCVEVCPTGSLWSKDKAQGQIKKNPKMIKDLVQKRKMNL